MDTGCLEASSEYWKLDLLEEELVTFVTLLIITLLWSPVKVNFPILMGVRVFLLSENRDLFCGEYKRALASSVQVCRVNT